MLGIAIRMVRMLHWSETCSKIVRRPRILDCTAPPISGRDLDETFSVRSRSKSANMSGGLAMLKKSKLKLKCLPSRI